jgi:hypothetical protein
MILAVASGKGGTRKTTVSVNLARTLGSDVQLPGCDVEARNAPWSQHIRARSGPAEQYHDRFREWREIHRAIRGFADRIFDDLGIYLPPVCMGSRRTLIVPVLVLPFTVIFTL